MIQACASHNPSPTPSGTQRFLHFVGRYFTVFGFVRADKLSQGSTTSIRLGLRAERIVNPSTHCRGFASLDRIFSRLEEF